MREILFRGKCEDNGLWFKGYLLGDEITGQYFIHASGNSVNESFKVGEEGVLHFLAFEVIPETIGQYTGVKDKNGKKIFEGDIVRYANCVHKVVFESRNGSGYFGIVIGEMETWPFGSSPADLMEVIGNIHDNPELLETAKKFWR